MGNTARLAALCFVSKCPASANVTVSTLTSNYRESQLELDSHTDACVLGRDALVIQDYHCLIEVTGYDLSLGTQSL